MNYYKFVDIIPANKNTPPLKRYVLPPIYIRDICIALITGKGSMVDVNMRNCTKKKGREYRQVPRRLAL